MRLWFNSSSVEMQRSKRKKASQSAGRGARGQGQTALWNSLQTNQKELVVKLLLIVVMNKEGRLVIVSEKKRRAMTLKNPCYGTPWHMALRFEWLMFLFGAQGNRALMLIKERKKENEERKRRGGQRMSRYHDRFLLPSSRFSHTLFRLENKIQAPVVGCRRVSWVELSWSVSIRDPNGKDE